MEEEDGEEGKVRRRLEKKCRLKKREKGEKRGEKEKESGLGMSQNHSGLRGPFPLSMRGERSPVTPFGIFVSSLCPFSPFLTIDYFTLDFEY